MNLVSKLSNRDDLHLKRKAWHVGTGVSGLAFYYQQGYSSNEMAKILFGLSFVVFLIETLRLNNKKFNEFSIKVMGPFMRKSEVNNYSGFVFYSFGIAVSLYLFPERYAVLSALFLIFADPISSLVGVSLGKRKISENKSLEGTGACALTCFFITLTYMNHYGMVGFDLIRFAVAAGIIGAVSELMSIWVNDNLTIPIVSGLGLTALSYLMV